MMWCLLLKEMRWLFWLGLLRWLSRFSLFDDSARIFLWLIGSGGAVGVVWEEHELVPVGCGRCWWVLLWLVVGKEELGVRGCWSWRCRTAGSSGAGVCLADVHVLLLEC